MEQSPSLLNDPAYEKIREKHKAKQEKKSEVNKAKYAAHKEAVENGEKKLIVERTPTGLYYVRWEGGGAIAPSLKGMFTSIDRLRTLAETKYGVGILK